MSNARDKDKYPELSYYEMLVSLLGEECQLLGTLEKVFDTLDNLEEGLEEQEKA